jgi:hypothetical protein
MTRRERLLRFALFGSVAAFFYTAIAATITTYAPPYSVSPPHFIAWLFYWPAFVVATLAILVALANLMKGIKLRECAAIAILAVPCLYYCLRLPRYRYLKEYSDNVRMGSEGVDEAGRVNGFLIDYYDRHPERFHYLGEDDQVEVEGFVESLITHGPLFIRGENGERDQIRTDGKRIISPAGDPLILLLDRHHDGFLRFKSQKRSVNDYADPWKKNGYNGEAHFRYSTAVGAVVREVPTALNDRVKNMPFMIVPLNDMDHKFYYR